VSNQTSSIEELHFQILLTEITKQLNCITAKAIQLHIQEHVTMNWHIRELKKKNKKTKKKQLYRLW